ncbi:hypothetical protein EIN_168890 [Entamoeba invadens IP1]|uniref:Uncharacterized protein n=1 Tax=Entamoeba invadens IP1 TaxID=370355 RepID=A0A0A1TVK5_ENTIV|nr:hypothetical protein EIN_168890 [Entamoeba invadens IP1]ELP84484.1 hypothetical protein EIN_168890 [Entamoeba invadens IP1]|eukprot:XP_004183830.1 hypothetical protein EIN_168890 [Entamoeba invadens IP1]
MEEIVNEVLEILKRFDTEKEDISFCVEQTIRCCEIVLTNKKTGESVKLQYPLMKCVLEPLVKDLVIKFDTLKSMSQNSEETMNVRNNFFGTRFDVVEISSFCKNNIKTTLFLAKENVMFSLFIFNDNQPCVDLKLIRFVEESIKSSYVDPYIFQDGCLISLGDFPCIGGIVFDISGSNFDSLKEVFSLAIQNYIGVSLNGPLIDKTCNSILSVINVSTNQQFVEECNMLLGSHPESTLRGLVSVASCRAELKKKQIKGKKSLI